MFAAHRATIRDNLSVRLLSEYVITASGGLRRSQGEASPPPGGGSSVVRPLYSLWKMQGIGSCRFWKIQVHSL